MSELEDIYLDARDSIIVPSTFQLEDRPMPTVDISASSVLSDMISIFKDARALGLKVPSHINSKFRNTLASPAYRDALESARLDPEEIGYVLGNKHRWDQGLCKYFALRSFKFYMQRTPRSPFDPDVFLLQYSMPNSPKYTILNRYKAADYGPRYVDIGPSIFYGNNRYMTIKLKTEYPNVSKGLDEFQLRWINMRYTKSLTTGNVVLQPVPKFKAKRKLVGRSLETRGQIRDQAGEIANFSFCALANAFKDLCIKSLDMLVGKPVPAESTGTYVPFDIINLLEKRNTKFRIVTYGLSALGPLFGEEGLTVDSEYRVNGDTGIYFLYGSPEDIKSLLEKGHVHHAYVAEMFRLSEHNLYGVVEPGTSVEGVLFETESTPIVITTSGVSTWEEPAAISSYEILNEQEIIESLGV